MATETQSASLPPRGQPPKHEHGIEMPLPTAYPFVLSVGVTMFGFGLATSLAISAVGLVIFVLGIIGWVGEMLPGRGHGHEEPAPEALRAKPVVGQTGLVEQLQPGMAGYRFRLPEKVHPISAGVWGGIVGGLVMPIPALLYGVISGKGFWFPVNLLAGMVMPGLEDRTKEQLGQFDLGLFIVAVAIHITMAVVLGLMYGVLLPTLPEISRPVAWGGLLMPLLWTAVTYSAMRIVDPDLNARVSWPWFIFSQFIFGMVAALTFLRARPLGTVAAGLLGGVVGGLVLPIPALLWSLAAGHGPWYPANLLAGIVQTLNPRELEQYHADWLATALGIHAVLSLGFGLIYGLLLEKLPVFPGPLAWGGILMPLLWTGTSYGLIGVVNQAMEKYVDWEYFLISQIVFGVAASIVVIRTEEVPIPPAGPGREPTQPQGAQP